MNIRISSKEQEELVTKNLKLVKFLVGKLNIPDSDFDDAVSVGNMGLVKAAATFNSSKNITFSTYACRCINNEIFMYLRSRGKHVNEVFMEDIISTDSSGKELTISDTIEDPDSDFSERIAQREILEKAISIILNLLKPKKKLIMLYMISGKSQEVIGKMLNLSQSYISRLIIPIQEEIKSYLTTQKQYREVFTMSIVGDLYELSFLSRDVKNFNKIFAALIMKLTRQELPEFKVVCNKERIIIRVRANPQSFSFIAQIIQEIDDYTVTYTDIHKESTDESELQLKGEPVEIKKVSVAEGSDQEVEVKNDAVEEVEEITFEEQNSIIQDNLTTSVKKKKHPGRKPMKQDEVRAYMLAHDNFTTMELKKEFPNMSIPTINMAINKAKKEGLIVPMGRGKFVTKKD